MTGESGPTAPITNTLPVSVPARPQEASPPPQRKRWRSAGRPESGLPPGDLLQPRWRRPVPPGSRIHNWARRYAPSPAAGYRLRHYAPDGRARDRASTPAGAMVRQPGHQAVPQGRLAAARLLRPAPARLPQARSPGHYLRGTGAVMKRVGEVPGAERPGTNLSVKQETRRGQDHLRRPDRGCVQGSP